MVLPLALGRGVVVVDFIPSLCCIENLGRGGRVRQRRGSRCAMIQVANEALTALNALAGFKGHPGEPVQ